MSDEVRTVIVQPKYKGAPIWKRVGKRCASIAYFDAGTMVIGVELLEAGILFFLGPLMLAFAHVSRQAADPRPWDCAKTNWTEADDGLSMEWFGIVWLNPPFDRYQVGKWIERLADHGNGIALVHARTETDWFQPIWRADLILFRRGRIKFCRPDGTEHTANSGAPPVFAGYGAEAAERLRESGMFGAYVELRPSVTLRKAA